MLVIKKGGSKWKLFVFVDLIYWDRIKWALSSMTLVHWLHLKWRRWYYLTHTIFTHCVAENMWFRSRSQQYTEWEHWAYTHIWTTSGVRFNRFQGWEGCVVRIFGQNRYFAENREVFVCYLNSPEKTALNVVNSLEEKLKILKFHLMGSLILKTLHWTLRFAKQRLPTHSNCQYFHINQFKAFSHQFSSCVYIINQLHSCSVS